MKRCQWRLVLGCLLLGGVVAPGGGIWCATAGADEAVTFADPNLETAVRDRLGIPPPEPVTATDMLGLYSLHVAGTGITDLAGLEYATNLELCFADFNAITSVEPLRELTPLVDLQLSSNLLTDISPIAGLTNLTVLNLGANHLTQVDVLSEMTKLDGLALYRNDISDISPLASLHELGDLDLTGNCVADVAPLAGLTELNVLGLGGNGLSDIAPLAGLSELRGLLLEENQISDISPLAWLTGLDYLDLRGNPLNQAAYDTYLPLIEANNPGIELHYDPIPEPATLALVIVGAAAIFGRTRQGANRTPRGHVLRCPEADPERETGHGTHEV
ncbi:MAG: leucine-rich repeat domain-containing protein [Phycisphaerae bacterium]